MAEKKIGRSSSISPKNKPGRKAVELDLTDPALYWDGVEWLRSNVLLKPSAGIGVLELDVRLPFEQMGTLLVNTKDLYILGFQGADQAYLLDDPLSPQFERLLKEHLGVGSQTKILKGLSSQHGKYGLGTFEKESKWEGKVFHKSDLKTVNDLAKYSLGMSHAVLRTPLSLLVCMVAESARFPMMQMGFSDMIKFGFEVIASDCIRSYDDAKFLIRVSRIAFPREPGYWAVERLSKRADELDRALEVLGLQQNAPNRQALIQQALNGKLPSQSPRQEHAREELQRVAKDLKVTDIARVLDMSPSEVITRLATTGKNDSAVYAARRGIAFPAVGIAT
jgi:hypothetical protein